MRRAALALVIVAVGAISACRLEGKKSPYAPIGADAGALRAAFNADAGKVRLVVLVAPT
jgi:hypothetical protein